MTPTRWRLVRDFAWVGSGTAVARAASLVALLVVVHAVSHEQFAAYAFGWALYQIVSQLLSGFDLAYVDLTARAERAHDLDAVYLRMKTLGTVVLGCGGAAVCGLIAHLDLGGHYSPAAIAGLVAGCVFGLFQTAMSRLQAHQRFRDFGRMVAIYNVVALGVTGALVGFGVTSAAVLLSAYTVSGIPWVWRLRHFAHTDRTRATRIAFAVHSRWLVLSSLVYGLALRAELFLATVFLTAEAFATYAAPARMFAIVEFTMATMGAVLLPNAARLSSSADLRGYVRRGVSVTLGFALVGGVVALERAPLADTLLGAHYHAAGLVPVFCLAAVVMSAYTSLKYLLFTARMPGHFAAVNTTMLIVKIVAGLVLIPLFGAAGAAWSVVAAYAVSTCVIAVLVRNLRPAAASRDLLVTAE